MARSQRNAILSLSRVGWNAFPVLWPQRKSTFPNFCIRHHFCLTNFLFFLLFSFISFYFSFFFHLTDFLSFLYMRHSNSLISISSFVFSDICSNCLFFKISFLSRTYCSLRIYLYSILICILILYSIP